MAKISTPDTYDYEGWSKLLGDKPGRKIANNTYLERRTPDSVAIRLHWTDIVTFHADGHIVLDDGGYQSVTTKERMDAVLPMRLRVFQRDFRWYVQVGGWDQGVRVDYERGMVLA